jgi:hypothetical protein
MLPVYQKELVNLRHNIDSLKTVKTASVARKQVASANAAVTLLTKTDRFYKLAAGAPAFADTSAQITALAPELAGLNGIRLSKARQVSQGTEVSFKTTKPVKLLVGYFTQKKPGYLPAPQLEIDASANDYGQADIKIANALVIAGMPPVNVHTYAFKAGTHTLNLSRGACLILGFIDANQPLRTYNAGLGSGAEQAKEIDWLFE